MQLQTRLINSDNYLYSPPVLDIIKNEDNTVSSFFRSKARSNAEFRKHLVEKFEPIFVSTLKSQELEIDYRNQIEILLEELFQENQLATKDWLNDVYVEHFQDSRFLINILKIIGNFDKELLSSFGIVPSGAALSHKSAEVKEMAIRVFENWNTIESYTFLKNCSLTPDWLEDYKNQVLFNIEEELCLI